jgi:hypothetical protein
MVILLLGVSFAKFTFFPVVKLFSSFLQIFSRNLLSKCTLYKVYSVHIFMYIIYYIPSTIPTNIPKHVKSSMSTDSKSLTVYFVSSDFENSALMVERHTLLTAYT